MRWFRIIAGLVLLVCISPFLSVLASGVIASIGGCKLDEGSIHPCVIGGHDYGHLASTLFMLGWFALATMPAAVTVALGWIAIEVIAWVRRSRE